MARPPATLSKKLFLTTKRLSIRPWRTDDAQALQRAANFHAVTRMTATMPFPYTLSDARAWILRSGHWLQRKPVIRLHLAVTHRGLVIGAIGADRDGDQAEIGYWLTPAAHGRGFMTEVVRAFVPRLFTIWNIKRVVGRLFLFNSASARVLEKCGFYKNALEPRAIKKNGRWFDVHVFVKYR